MRTTNLLMLGLVSTLCSFPLEVTAYDSPSREARTKTILAQERQDLARQEAQLAQDSIALEERRAALAKRRAALIEHEQQLTQDSSTRRERSETGRDVDQTLTDLGARESDRGFVLTLSDIQFRRDESELSADTMRKLYPLITLVKDESQRNIIIEGYTDSIGDESYNRELSERRATAVRDFLVSAGIDPRRISVRGYGEEHPIASNDSENGRRENRRVEVIVTRDANPRTAER
jgi:outer membrane protein OmpA-like peptidoglycan-associated protein